MLVTNIIRQPYVFDIDQERVSVAQLLRDSFIFQDAAHRYPCF